MIPLLILLAWPVAVGLAQDASEAGFESIFDGQTLNDWDGDPNYWRVEDGKLVGVVTPDTILDRNTFIIWRGGEVADFELRLDYRISDSGNSGINYRSLELPDLPYAMRGYQADLHGGDRYTGNAYEERGRTFLALRGQKTVVEAEAVATVIERFGSPDDLQALIRKEDAWNEVIVLARGRHVQHYFNGRLFAEFIDNDTIAGRRRGLLGVQVHVGPPMRVEFRNIRLKRLGDTESEPVPLSRLPPRKSNAEVLPVIESQAEALLAPGPNSPLSGRARLSVTAKPRYVRGAQTDLALLFEGTILKIPNVPAPLSHLDCQADHRFDLEWSAGAYRVRRVTSAGRAVYMAP